MESILRSTIAAGAILAIAASALMPGHAWATERSDGSSQAFVAQTSMVGATDFVAPGGGGTAQIHIGCGPGSTAPFTPCDLVKRICALLGGDFGEGGCTTADWPPPPKPD